MKMIKLSEQFQTSIEKNRRNRGKIYIPNTQIHDHLLSWLDTSISIKYGEVKLN